MNTFWDNYYRKPLNEIPWQNTQDDWLKELVDSGAIAGEAALDLGCGTGSKSVYLAQNAGFKKVIGVDISVAAIAYAKSNAQDAKVEDNCTFIIHDLADWSFLKNDETFDFILDWAAIHCIPADKLETYAKNISLHCKAGGKFLIRSFTSADPKEKYFEEEIDGIKSRVSLLTEEDLCGLFPQFQVLSRNISQPGKPKVEAGYYFIELLMQKEHYL